MHIGFDISQTGAQKAGCGYYAYALARSFPASAPQHRFSFYPSFGDFYFDAGMPRANPYPAPNSAYGPCHATIEEARAFWNDPALERALGSPDVIHANNFWCPIQLRTSRLVYTLHDLAFVENPAWTTEINRAGCWDGVSRSAVSADWIAAISESSRAHYLRIFPDFPSERIRVIHPCSRFTDASMPDTRPAALDGVPPGGYWLSVGTIEPRKNQLRTAEAFARWRETTGRAEPLVFAGGRGWLMDNFAARLEELGIARHVILTGYVTDAELAWLYRNCLANIYVSHFEGFGLPVLEGMQFGAATIASNTTSIPEVAGDAAILVDPGDTQALLRAMSAIAASIPERNRLSHAARMQAARFQWRASAASLLRLYEEAVEKPKRRPGVGLHRTAWRRFIGYGERVYRKMRSAR